MTNQPGAARAWNNMLAVLSTHERQHRSIGRPGATLKPLPGSDFTVTGSDQVDATQKASE
jgi:hypothetical protein